MELPTGNGTAMHSPNGTAMHSPNGTAMHSPGNGTEMHSPNGADIIIAAEDTDLAALEINNQTDFVTSTAVLKENLVTNKISQATTHRVSDYLQTSQTSAAPLDAAHKAKRKDETFRTPATSHGRQSIIKTAAFTKSRPPTTVPTANSNFTQWMSTTGVGAPTTDRHPKARGRKYRRESTLEIVVAVLSTLLFMVALILAYKQFKRLRRKRRQRHQRESTQQRNDDSLNVVPDETSFSSIQAQSGVTLAITNEMYNTACAPDQFVVGKAYAVNTESRDIQHTLPGSLPIRSESVPFQSCVTRESSPESAESDEEAASSSADYRNLHEAATPSTDVTLEISRMPPDDLVEKTTTLLSRMSSYPCSDLSVIGSDMYTIDDERSRQHSFLPSIAVAEDFEQPVDTEMSESVLNELYDECDETYMTHAVAIGLSSSFKEVRTQKPRMQTRSCYDRVASCSVLHHPAKSSFHQHSAARDSHGSWDSQGPARTSHGSAQNSHGPTTGTIQNVIAIEAADNYHEFLPTGEPHSGTASSQSAPRATTNAQKYTEECIVHDVYSFNDEKTRDYKADRTSSAPRYLAPGLPEMAKESNSCPSQPLPSPRLSKTRDSGDHVYCNDIPPVSRSQSARSANQPPSQMCQAASNHYDTPVDVCEAIDDGTYNSSAYANC